MDIDAESLDRCKICGLIKCTCPKRLTWNNIKYSDQSEKEYSYNPFNFLDKNIYLTILLN